VTHNSRFVIVTNTQCSESAGTFINSLGVEITVSSTWFGDSIGFEHANRGCPAEPKACCMGAHCYTTPVIDCILAGGYAPFIASGVGPPGLMESGYFPTCARVLCGDQVWCCLEHAHDPPQCRFADTAEQCRDLGHWASNPIDTYVIPDGMLCGDVCGKEHACCVDDLCYDTTWRQCERWGGEPSATCLTCDDDGPCCPIPVPCCLCNGDCLILFPRECDDRAGVSAPGIANCQDAAQFCQGIDLRPSCASGVWMVVPSREDPEQYELLSTTPIWIEDYPDETVLQHHYAHVDDKPWLCHRWDEPRDLYEKSICGVALNEGGNLGNCIPEGHGAIICGWQPPCPELV